MNYKIVNLEEKKLVGLSCKTSNSDPMMGQLIGGLWKNLYQDEVIANIKYRSSQYAIGLYSDYEGESYQVTVGTEVSKSENPELTTKIIPAGKYAKFMIHGHMQQAVAQAWGEIWKMDLDRSYAADFEEYLSSDMDDAQIAIYISLK